MSEYPFAKELITNTRGQVHKVVLDFRSDRRLIAEVEDAGLYRAMKRAAREKPLTREQALEALEKR